jgi:hypothetical protein
MEIAKYATGLLLVVGCGAPVAGDEVASYQDSIVGAEEEQIWLQTRGSELSTNPTKKKPKKSLEVNFGGCTEFAGLTFVPTENVADLVPPQFELLHLTTDAEAVVVVRVADCSSVQVKSGKGKRGTVAQVGVSMIGPDATSDINNYTLWYATDNKELAHELSKLGVDAVYSQDIDYDFFPTGSGSGPFSIAVAADSHSEYVVNGSATTPTSAAVPFVASWWYETCQGTVQMRTDLPQIQFGQASMTLGALGDDIIDVVGASPLTFPALDSYNAFAQAQMVVSVN